MWVLPWSPFIQLGAGFLDEFTLDTCDVLPLHGSPLLVLDVNDGLDNCDMTDAFVSVHSEELASFMIISASCCRAQVSVRLKNVAGGACAVHNVQQLLPRRQQFLFVEIKPKILNRIRKVLW